jgi:hypothetical protein
LNIAGLMSRENLNGNAVALTNAPNEDNPEHYKKLFRYAKGRIMVASSQYQQYSYSRHLSKISFIFVSLNDILCLI